MKYEDFIVIWNKIIKEGRIHKVILNNVGDLYYHPECVKILKYINRNRRDNLWITLLTNGSKMNFIPQINELLISFNGGNNSAFEQVTGLSCDRVTYNIKYHYNMIKQNVNQAELNILIFKDNAESEKDIKKMWNDFPGKVRISYKYDNQGGKDLTLKKYKSDKRIFCNYLDLLSVDWNGNVIMCAHDWNRENIWGNFLQVDYDDLFKHPLRIEKIKEHGREEYTGLCENCNYNVSEKGLIKYV